QGGGYSAYRPVVAQQPAPPPQPAASGYSSAPGYSAASPGLSDLLSQYQAATGVASPAPAPAQAPASTYQAMPQVDPLQALQALQVLQQYQSRGNYQHHYQPQQPPQQQAQPQPYYQQAFGNRYSRSSRSSKAAKTTAGGGSSRASRDLDVQGQLETLTTRMTGRVKNVTCVMQELGYVSTTGWHCRAPDPLTVPNNSFQRHSFPRRSSRHRHRLSRLLSFLPHYSNPAF
ncbi:sterile alpha motif domain-containing protein 1-like, partial [Frankliniella occidentalis]|uniref:Sterile alpha motif domain-containing protein 1-like n=1 Tax=Frankliniella occidentalis TaxID=133901 RepID=A0A9C6XVI7_FRAOC